MTTLRMNTHLLTLALLTNIWFVSVCQADSPAAPREFEIELLVFQNLIASDAGEVWPVDYSEWFEESDVEDSGIIPAPVEIDWLPKQDYRLTAERNALSRSTRYRPLAYFAWRQSVLDRTQALPIELPASDTDTYIDGTVRVAVERYLHLYLNLQLHTPVSNEQFELLEFDIPDFRLNEHRRMRSKEIHYFDNPRFGVIALITPYKPPPPETDPAIEKSDQSPVPDANKR